MSGVDARVLVKPVFTAEIKRAGSNTWETIPLTRWHAVKLWLMRPFKRAMK